MLLSLLDSGQLIVEYELRSTVLRVIIFARYVIQVQFFTDMIQVLLIVLGILSRDHIVCA